METPSDLWILDDGLIMGGGQRFALRLARVMAADGMRVRIVAPARSRMARQSAEYGFDVVDARYPRLVPPAVWAMPQAVSRLRRVLRDLPPDALVIGNTARCQAYATAAMLTMSPRPLFVHLMAEQDSAHRPTARAVYRRFGALVAIGENATATYRERLPRVPVTGINNFLDEADMERMAARRVPPPGGPRPVVGVVARMIPEKGLVELVEELATIPDAWSRLRFAGPEQDPAYAAEVRSRIAALGLDDRVEVLGEVPNLAAFVGTLDALVVPSTGNEGQPTVILEGLLYGRPVIVREPLWVDEYATLPVRRYGTPAELGDALADPPEPTTVDDLARHFGAQQVVERVVAAAVEQRNRQDTDLRPDALSRPLGGRRADGNDWMRHFMRHRSVSPRGAPVPTMGSYAAFVAGLPRSVLGSRRSFAFGGLRYPYRYDRYNLTWLNERAVELPIAAAALEAHRGERVLEIGNVMAHYGHGGHEVVDKYEHEPNVRNVDVLDLEPDRRWDLILSISTLEHVGVDETPRDPRLGATAAQLLAERLAPGGELLITVPVGYNAELDDALVAGALPGLELQALRRTAAGPHWEQVDPATVVGLGYDWRNSSARAVLVGRLRADSV